MAARTPLTRDEAGHPARPTFTRRAVLRTATAGTVGAALAMHSSAASAQPSRKKSATAGLAGRPLPVWYDDAKLGIFIHWNAASIPAFAPVWPEVHLDDPELFSSIWRQRQFWRTLPYAEMYQNTMAVPGSETNRHHAEKYDGIPYDNFVSRFRTESIPRWNPRPWAKLFKESGAGYVVLTTKTEDGFLLWPSRHRNPHKDRWQSERDVVGELAAAVRDRGLRFGAYYSGGMDWTFGGLPITDGLSLMAAAPRTDEYFAYWDAHWREIIDRYQPSVLWNDYGLVENPGLDLEALFRTYYSRVQDGVINPRFDSAAQDSGELHADIKSILEYSTKYPDADAGKWEAARGFGSSFGYNRLESDRNYLTSTELIHMFVDIVAHGGNLLINVGPKATGQIPAEQAQKLRALGRWLRGNGEAIYGTRRWRRPKGVTTEALPVRYTASKEAVHAIVLGTPMGRAVDIDVKLDDGAVVTQAGSGERLAWAASPHGARISLNDRPRDEHAFSLRITPAAAVHDPAASE